MKKLGALGRVQNHNMYTKIWKIECQLFQKPIKVDYEITNYNYNNVANERHIFSHCYWDS